MINELLEDAETRMGKTVESLTLEFAKLRSGRAHPSLLDHLTVEYYGSETPLSQCANIVLEDARTLMISPWEKTMVQPIEKAIMKSDLGLTPNTSGTVIRIGMPPLTEERRKDMVKIVRQEAENARVAVRNIRRDCNQDIKDLLQEKEISEDEMHGAEQASQKLTDRFVKEIDDMMAVKEKDMMEV